MRSLRRFSRHWQNLLGLAIVVFFAVIAIFAPRMSPKDSMIITTAQLKLTGNDRLFPARPSAMVPIGTIPIDHFKHYNIFYFIVWGTRSAFIFGLVVVLSTALIGVVIGAIAGNSPGWLNNGLMRITDAMLAFPIIVGVVLFQTILNSLLLSALKNDPIGYWIARNDPTHMFDVHFGPLATFLMQLDPLMVALILFSWMPYARIVNTLIIKLRQLDYVEASRALGAGKLRITFRHLIPNAISPALVLAARDIGFVVVLQATFTYIHITGGSYWGELLNQAQRWIIGPGGNVFVRWWVFFPATLALILFGVGWNLVGDGLNDLLNPQSY